MSGPRLASILTSHTSHEGAELDDFARSLGDDERQSLLGELAVRATRSDSGVAALLRALLGAAPLRFAAAQEAMRLMRSEVLTGKAGVLCLTELRVALIQYWECRGAFHLGTHQSSGPPSEPAESRLRDVLTMCEDVIAALVPQGGAQAHGRATSAELPTSAGGSGYGGWGDGCTAVLQLLPVLLRAADVVDTEVRWQLASASGAHAEDPGPRANAARPADESVPSSRFLERLLASEWQLRLVLP